jgi:hypothetical protein
VSHLDYREPSGCGPQLVMTVGGMMALLCGGCTVWVVHQGGELYELAYLFGGVPAAIGVVLFLIGLAQSRRTGGRKGRRDG